MIGMQYELELGIKGKVEKRKGEKNLENILNEINALIEEKEK